MRLFRRTPEPRQYTITAGIMHPIGESPDSRRIERLAQYHEERMRGLVHTPNWDAFMREEQAWFDALAERGEV